MIKQKKIKCNYFCFYHFIADFNQNLYKIFLNHKTLIHIIIQQLHKKLINKYTNQKTMLQISTIK